MWTLLMAMGLWEMPLRVGAIRFARTNLTASVDSVPQMPVPRSHGYGVTIGNVQVPTTPRPPSCFYKSERYEHGDSVGNHGAMS
ncbi:hypothetical protein MRX96_015692 [Rhipicephalus microplus]